MHHANVILITCVLLFSTCVQDSKPQDCGGDNGIEVRVLPDSTVYRPGSTMHLKFLVTNQDKAPVYFYRVGMSACTGQMGFLSFLVLDEHGKEANTSGCSGDTWPLGMSDAVKMLSDPDSGIRLRRYEIYGFEWEERLPTKKGTYRLKVELVPAFFSDQQREALSERHMRVLQCKVAAPVVTIVVK